MNPIRRYIFAALAFILAFSYACERIEPVGVDGDSEGLTTIINQNVISLDTASFKYIGLIDGKLIFDLHGTPDIPLEGDIIYYPGSDFLFTGKVKNLINEGKVLRFNLQPVPLNSVFDFLLLRNELGPGSAMQTTYINPVATESSDTLSFELIEFFWNFSELQWGFFKIDSLVINNEIRGEQQFIMGPVWSEGIGTKRIELELAQNTHFRAVIDFFSRGDLDYADSIRIRERLYGPYYAGSVPVYYRVGEWLKIKLLSSGNNNFVSGFSLYDRSEVITAYRDNKGWDISSVMDPGIQTAEHPAWDKQNPYSVSLSLNTVFSPVFCGVGGPELRMDKHLLMSANAEWPEWDYYISNDCILGFVPGSDLFSDIPDNDVQMNLDSRLIFAESGQLENHPPEPHFTISPLSGFTDTNFEFDASKSTDFEDDPGLLQVRWDFNGDKLWDTNYSTIKIAYHLYPVPGNYTVIMEVADTHGSSSQLVRNVMVQETSSAPTAFFTVTPESGRISDLFTFDASGSWDREDVPALLKVRWDFEGDDVWDTQFSTVKAAFHFFREPGTYLAKLEVKDTQGLTGSTTRIINVADVNIKPTAFFTVTPENGTINTSFLFDASGSSDPEDDISLLEVRWDWENNGVWDTEYRTIKTISHVFNVAATYRVVLEVRDTDGFSNTYSRDIVVSNPNTPPKADFTISPAKGDTTTMFTFDASISTDLEDSLEDLLFRWDWNNDDVYDTEFSSNPILEKNYPEIGTYIIKLQVKDSGGLTHTKARLVIVE